ncbi:hypothetical protein [Mariniblastus fucicola]|uniref:Uncharacterized protein n=1 Tax=Mariniblastus fucicola TaxID=980251 RepID=A0A5B9PE19_9BACT|nr:hypothetical protein [Mariniblastus fucicola]QEG23182.1 hypothetical protein MFFC18_30780 [Mariniblastus fucicola]
MPWKQKPFGWGKALSGESLFPPVKDATVAVLKQVKEIIDADHSIEKIIFNVDTLEPPSVGIAIQLMLDKAENKLEFETVSAAIPEPDPRSSTATNPLWELSDDSLVPIADDPKLAIKLACADVVASSKDCLQSWERAVALSEQFDLEQVDSLLAVMLFPPPVEAGFSSTEWVRRIQLAAAQLAVNLERMNAVSLQDSKVADVTRGPLDWTTDSAMVALAQRANMERQLVGDVCELAQNVMERVPDEGTWSCREVASGVIAYLESVAETGGQIET